MVQIGRYAGRVKGLRRSAFSPWILLLDPDRTHPQYRLYRSGELPLVLTGLSGASEWQALAWFMAEMANAPTNRWTLFDDRGVSIVRLTDKSRELSDGCRIIDNRESM